MRTVIGEQLRRKEKLRPQILFQGPGYIGQERTQSRKRIQKQLTLSQVPPFRLRAPSTGAGHTGLERTQREGKLLRSGEKLSPAPSEWPSIYLGRSHHLPGLVLGCPSDCRGDSSPQKPPPGIQTLRLP